jgi:hypothetical protein
VVGPILRPLSLTPLLLLAEVHLGLVHRRTYNTHTTLNISRLWQPASNFTQAVSRFALSQGHTVKPANST